MEPSTINPETITAGAVLVFVLTLIVTGKLHTDSEVSKLDKQIESLRQELRETRVDQRANAEKLSEVSSVLKTLSAGISELVSLQRQGSQR